VNIENAAAVLNRLIEAVLDSADDYSRAAELVRNPALQSRLHQRAERRRALAQDLQAQVRQMGGQPWDKGSFRGLAGRAALELRNRMAGHDDALVKALMRGEVALHDQFSEAAASELPDDVRRLILRATKDEFDLDLSATPGEAQDSRPSPAGDKHAEAIMAHFKLDEATEDFLKPPQEGTILFAGASGTETWIERDRDMVVRLAIKSAAVATADGGALEVCIEIGGDSARGRDGPAAIETQLRASQSVQVLVKAGVRTAFKAYPTASDAQVLRTIVWAADLIYDRASLAAVPAEPSR
jgi:uncharacterized protein (TIGR02284 family)